jgi:hypothetical protein
LGPFSSCLGICLLEMGHSMARLHKKDDKYQGVCEKLEEREEPREGEKKVPKGRSVQGGR